MHRHVFSTLLVALFAACTGGGSRALADGSARRAVVVELFSSEGCSSCPAADRLLSSLAATQPIAGADILPLEFHVDYWNDLGWVDPFSKPAFTTRQRAYAPVFGRSGMYTPQMIVDGHLQFVGSSESSARRAIGEAALLPAFAVTFSRASGDGHLSVEAIGSNVEAFVAMALTESGLVTDVKRGENRGARLEHAPVVRDLKLLGALDGGHFKGSLDPDIAPEYKRENLRVVVFVQSKRDLSILGAASTRP